MRAYDIIRKKRDGKILNAEEINYLIQGFTRGEVPDYQMAAWAMAVCCRGMDPVETVNLTRSMVASGETIDLSAIPGIKVDKHSTGGVGDTTTLVLAPLIAAAGGRMAKMSGRGLGHTGGTLDKFEAIPGFQVTLTRDEFTETVQRVGAAVVGQSGNLVPADKQLYALRDVTATVESIPLIASSVMSKKIAAGADAIVLDVKAGQGAFVKDVDQAFALAHILVEIGKQMGRETVALVTSMHQPLGKAIGNALEVMEAVETLRGAGPADLRELCLALGALLLVLSKVVQTEAEGRSRLEQLLGSGAGLTKLQEMVKAQKGNPQALEDWSLLPQAQKVVMVRSPLSGYVQEIKAEEMGFASTLLGAGRETKDSVVDLAVGIVLNKKVGDPVEAGEPLAFLHVNHPGRLEIVQQKVQSAFQLAREPVPVPPLIYGIVGIN
ncbi:MAG: pyrimidine-nucleoside phosphorylase [Syntrophomonadaceae bacterium]|nr:pyrimidine-nucleoside phosphorylase [Syntrophomonadaceae bacterium]